MFELIRLLAILFAAMWGLFGYAIIDLTVLLTWNAWFVPVLPLEASWGALLTFFVTVPFVVVAVRPRRWADAVVTGGVAVAALVAGAVLAADAATLLIAGVLALCVGGLAIPGSAGRRSGELLDAPPWRGRLDIPLLLLGLAAVPLWAPYVVNATAGADDLPSDVTLGLDHWPVHIAAGIAVPAGALVAATIVRIRTLAASASALSAITIGVAMAASQGRPAATESAHWSVVAVLWGASVLMAVIWALQRTPRARRFRERVDRASSRSTS